MTQPGPSPLPSAVREGRSAQPSRMNEREPQPSRRAPEPPGWVRDNPDVLEVWERVVEELRHMGIAHRADSDVIAGYAGAVVWLGNAAQVLKYGVVVPRSKSGGEARVVVRSPAGTEYERYWRIVRAGAQELGLSPSARTRIEAPDADDPDEGDGEPAQIVDLFDAIARAQRRGDG